MYLLFSQIYQIPRYQVNSNLNKLTNEFDLNKFELQVISGLEYFTDTGLKQHLEYALHNVITSSISNDSQVSGSIGSKLKDAFKKTENKFSSLTSNWFKNKKPKKSAKSGKKGDASEKMEKTNG